MLGTAGLDLNKFPQQVDGRPNFSLLLLLLLLKLYASFLFYEQVW